MQRRRQTSARGETEASGTVRTTVVGGHSSSTEGAAIPRGMEVLVKKAAVDAAFRDTLMRERSRAAAAIELPLDPTEAAVIDGVPETGLAAMIDKARVPPSQRKAFMGSAAAVMLAAIGAMPHPANAQASFGILPDRRAYPRVTWQGLADVQYEVYSSDDLEAWSFVGSFEGVDGEMVWLDQAAYEEGLRRRYYKVARRLPMSKGNTLEPVPTTIEVEYPE